MQAVPKHDPKLTLSARNLQDLSVRPVAELNAYDVVKHKDLLLTREALNALLASRSAKPAVEAKAKPFDKAQGKPAAKAATKAKAPAKPKGNSSSGAQQKGAKGEKS